MKKQSSLTNSAEHSNVIRGVEIFSSGKHNGDEYTEQDLDDMVAAFGALDYRPALKVGHSKDSPGSPAYGWVQNVKRVGEKLVADFTDMHDSVLDAIRTKAYDRVSSEVYFNLNRGGKKFRRALKAVALLGAEVPAVAGLMPLHKVEFAAEGEYEAVYAVEGDLQVPSTAVVDALAERVNSLITLVKEHTMMTREQMMAKCKKDHPDMTPAEMKAWVDKQMESSTHDKEQNMDVKQLKAKVAELTAQIKELGGSDDDDKAERIAELTEQITALSTQIAEYHEGETAKALSAANEALKESNARIATLEAEQRARNVTEKTAALRVPAFRPSVQALYTYAYEHPEAQVKTYAKDKDGKDVVTDSALTAVVDTFVADINAQAEKLFKALATTGSEGRDGQAAEDDPSAEVDKRTKAWMREKSVKSYSDAMQAVLESDAALAKSYAESQSAAN